MKKDAKTKVAKALVERFLEVRSAMEVAYERVLGKLAIRVSLLRFFSSGLAGWGGASKNA
jgi:hypothetical protein